MAVRPRLTRLGVSAGLLGLTLSMGAPTMGAASVVTATPRGVALGGAANRAASPPTHASEPKICADCTPPLTYKGGLVMGTPQAAGEVTITPIFWAPDGFAFPSSYTRIVDGYITDVAAASGTSSNVYSINTEYSETVGQTTSQIQYQIHAGTAITDTSPFPSGGCTPSAGYTACVTDAQLRTELSSVISQNQLVGDLGHLYPVFFPSGVMTADGDGGTSVSDFCGYHSAFGTVVYTNEPFGTPNGCGSGQAPNGDVNADSELGVLSHEISEAITDPLSPRAWDDASGSEIGDQCNQYYGTPLGSTNPDNPEMTSYNQVINGNKYYTQDEFSNATFNALGVGQGCIQRESSAPSATAARLALAGAAAAQTPGNTTLDAFPDELAADGSAASTIKVTVYQANGEPAANDHVHFNVGARSNAPGRCGTLSMNDGFTNGVGELTVSYQTSSDNLACYVVAIEAQTGSSDQVVIYQGTAAQERPAITANAPGYVVPGAPPVSFTMKVTNQSSHPIGDARVDVVFTGNDTATSGVTASQVHLSYQDETTHGQFVNVPLSGETTDGGEIDGFLGSEAGFVFAAGATKNITFKISVDRGAPTSLANGSPLTFEGDIDQINPADGSLTFLNFTTPTGVNLASSANCGIIEAVLAQTTDPARRAALQVALATLHCT